MFPFDSFEKNILLFYNSRQVFYHIILVWKINNNSRKREYYLHEIFKQFNLRDFYTSVFLNSIFDFLPKF